MGMQAALEQISAEKLSEFIQNLQRAYKHILASITYQGDAMLGQAMGISGMNPEELLRTSLEGIDKQPGISAEQRAQIRDQVQKQFEQVLSRVAAVQSAKKPGLQLVKGNKITPEEPRKICSLEKDWHMLHYILNGTTEGGTGPLADVVLGGTEIPDREGVMGYGAVRYLTPEQVKAVSEAMAKVDFVTLAEKFDPEDAATKQIYGLPHRPSEQMLSQMLKNMPPEKAQAAKARFDAQPKMQRLSPDEVGEFLKPVQAFYADAAQNGNAMLLYLT